MFTVKLIEISTGHPICDEKVSVYINGFFTGGFLPAQRTNSEGEAHFDHENATGIIYVDGIQKYEGYLSGRKVIYL